MKKYSIASLGVFVAGASAAAVIGTQVASAATGSLTYGYGCQDTFNGVLADINACSASHAFAAQMDGIATKVFNYTLGGTIGPRILEEAFDQGNMVESADVAYIATHMGAWQNTGGADIAGRDFTGVPPTFGVEAHSHNMRLGNEDKGLSVLALAGCTTLAGNPRPDGNGTSTPKESVFEGYWDRWNGAFKGGLRIVVGNWDEYFLNNKVGDLFGKYLKAGETVANAWNRADREGMPNNDTAVGSMSNSTTDCWNRVNGMTINNLGNYPRMRDGQVSSWCRRWWSNDSISGN